MSKSDLYLSPNQRNLLVAALTSNQSTTQDSRMASRGREDSQNAFNAYTPAGASGSSAPGSSRLDLDDSPYIDFPLDGDGDDSFDFDTHGQMFADLGADDGADDAYGDSADHLHDKRKSMDDQDEDDEGGGKRREGDDKTAKRPGRKPLTSEPTSVSVLEASTPQLLTVQRNERLKIELHNALSGKERKSISKTSRLKLKISKRLRKLRTMKMACSEPKSSGCRSN